ncbi:chemotaxis protein, partial [Methylobacterium sp. E-005]|nr:chemotaxis protein [Methylobacterium sp. E-005]
GETAIREAANPATRPDAVRIEAEGRGKQFFDTRRGKLAATDNLEERTRAEQVARVAKAQRD